MPARVERRKDVGGAAIQVSGVPVKALRDTAVYLTGWSRRDIYGVGISLAVNYAGIVSKVHTIILQISPL